MRVRVKYCGGCNPRYDRKAVVERLRAAFPRVEFIERDEDEPYDHVIVLAGCHSSCASHADLNGTYGKTVVATAEESDALEDALRSLPGMS